jgi:nicotinate-nucleotide adenylyltransferase
LIRKLHPWLTPPGPVSPGLKIGLLGGSFNPAHEGHLHISEVALKKLGLDYVWWLVSPQNPLKSQSGMAPLAHRLAFAAEKYEHHPRIVVMDVETTLHTRFTIDTITKLKRRFPQVHFVWLMGTDNLANFNRWRRWQDIAKSLPIAAVMRPGSTLAPLCAKAVLRFSADRHITPKSIALAAPPAMIVVDGPRNAASATAIRARSGWDEALVRAIPPC